MLLRVKIILIILCILSVPAFAKFKYDTDSLQKVLVMNISDTARLHTMARLSDSYLHKKQYATWFF